MGTATQTGVWDGKEGSENGFNMAPLKKKPKTYQCFSITANTITASPFAIKDLLTFPASRHEVSIFNTVASGHTKKKKKKKMRAHTHTHTGTYTPWPIM